METEDNSIQRQLYDSSIILVGAALSIQNYTRILTKNSIIDDMGVPDPPLVCLFSMRNITKNNKTYRSRHLHVQSQKEGY